MARQKIEEINQVAFVRWFRLKYPHLSDYMTLGSFGENIGFRRMNRLKQMGLTPGYPDLIFNIPKLYINPVRLVAGLMIEMKTKKGRLSPAQKVIHSKLIKQRYEVCLAKSWDEAKEFTIDYLSDLSCTPDK